MMGNRLMVGLRLKILRRGYDLSFLSSRQNAAFPIIISFNRRLTDSIGDRFLLFVKSKFLKSADICYKSSVFRPAKMF
jgi:hypothetical protein